MKTQILHWFGLLSVLIFAGLLAGESVACVTCENMACKSITSGGALNCLAPPSECPAFFI